MESRKHPRYACDLPCRMVLVSTTCEARVVNVSREGIFILSELMMDEGTRFVVELEAGGPDPIAVNAELVHWRHLRPDEEGDGAMGYGVRVSPTPAFAELVEDLAEQGEALP